MIRSRKIVPAVAGYKNDIPNTAGINRSKSILERAIGFAALPIRFTAVGWIIRSHRKIKGVSIAGRPGIRSDLSDFIDLIGTAIDRDCRRRLSDSRPIANKIAGRFDQGHDAGGQAGVNILRTGNDPTIDT
jgi:hypothetical protein